MLRPGILERHELAAVGKRNRIIETPLPSLFRHPGRTPGAAVRGRVAERRTEVNLTDQGYCAHRLAGSNGQGTQSRTCRFLASGSSRERFAHSGVAVDDR
jgi:hypothetical protein